MVGFAVAAFGPKGPALDRTFPMAGMDHRITNSLLVAAALLYFIVKRF
jgi:hypothetical protein